MSIGADVQNTTYSDLRPAKAKSGGGQKQKRRRKMIKRALKGQEKSKPEKKQDSGY